MGNDDNRGPDWRRTRRIRFRACDIDDSWVYRYPVLCTFAGVIVAFMLSVAMFGTRRDNPKTWGVFEILAGCGLVWNAIAVAIQQGPQAQTEGATHAAYILKLLAGIFLMVEGHKDRERAHTFPRG